MSFISPTRYFESTEFMRTVEWTERMIRDVLEQDNGQLLVVLAKRATSKKQFMRTAGAAYDLSKYKKIAWPGADSFLDKAFDAIQDGLKEWPHKLYVVSHDPLDQGEPFWVPVDLTQGAVARMIQKRYPKCSKETCRRYARLYLLIDYRVWTKHRTRRIQAKVTWLKIRNYSGGDWSFLMDRFPREYKAARDFACSHLDVVPDTAEYPLSAFPRRKKFFASTR